ncbi:MAG: 50S ribosomal protein L11 [Nanoarchaeota archaeon]
MPKTEKLDLMIEGGNAKPDASIAQRLGPLKLNIADIIKKINDKTANFKGMKIPVKLEINTVTKEVNINVGTPPTTELIKKELSITKGAGTPNKEKIGNVAVENLVKIAKMKMDGMLDKTLKAAIKTVAGSCNSMGLLIEGKTSDEFNKDLESGMYNSTINSEKIEVPLEKQEKLKQELVVVNERLRKEQEKLKARLEAEAKPKEEKPAEEAAAEEAGAEAKPGEAKVAPAAKGKEVTPATKAEAKPAAKEEKKK